MIEDLLQPTESTVLSDDEYLQFEQDFEKLSGIRLTGYKEKQMKRRINTLIGRKKLDGYEGLLSHLKTDAEFFAEFKDYITINVTEFFRTPEHWGNFEKDVLPELLGRKDEIKIWSCACATGEEAYSLAMSLCRLADSSRFHIIATDIDEKVLCAAREGVYSGQNIEKLSAETKERFFIQKGTNFSVADELKSCVEFKQLDLLKDPYPCGCDLIVCRNVLIYFTEDSKNTIYTKLKNSLNKGGYLFTGNTEQIIYYKNFGYKKCRNYIYQNV